MLRECAGASAARWTRGLPRGWPGSACPGNPNRGAVSCVPGAVLRCRQGRSGCLFCGGAALTQRVSAASLRAPASVWCIRLRLPASRSVWPALPPCRVCTVSVPATTANLSCGFDAFGAGAASFVFSVRGRPRESHVNAHACGGLDGRREEGRECVPVPQTRNPRPCT